MAAHTTLDARYAQLLTNLCRYSCVSMKIKFYIPRTRNVELDDVLNDILKRALKGYDYLQSPYLLQNDTVEELKRRHFAVAEVSGCHVIQWYTPLM